MEIRAFLNDDGSASCSFGEPGQMAGFEADAHKVELRLTAADGALVRSVTREIGGQTVVDGPSPAPVAGAGGAANGTASADVEVQHAPEPTAEKPAAVETHGESVPGGAASDGVAPGFAGFSQHADEVK